MPDTRIILASGSPRRRELLSKMGYEFTVCAPDVDENVTGSADDIVMELAVRKGRAVAERFSEGIVIASDTLVSLGGTPLGKPADRADAVNMLKSLSGKEHDVFTGVCVIDASSKAELVRLARTGVLFRDITEEEIETYVDSGEPMDKAGAYAIQGGAGAFVVKLDGTFENVMGFPVDVVRDMLDEILRG